MYICMIIPLWLFCGEDWISYKGVGVINVMWDIVSKDNIFRTFDLFG